VCVRFLVLLALEGLVVSLWGPLGAQALVILSQTSRLRAAVYGSPGFAPPPHGFWFLWFPPRRFWSPSGLPLPLT
jgi:hypothetical protein